MENAIVLDINAGIVQKTISIRKSKKIELPDAIIAATALVHGFTLISRNTSDFKNIMGLKVIDPYGL
jgi:predicted nucleic acid-binding protein